MNKKMKLIVAVFLLVVATGSFWFMCNPAKLAPEIKEIKNVSLQSIDSTNIKINAKIVLYNKNKINLHLNKADLKIYCENINIGHAENSEPITILANTLTEGNINLVLNSKQISKIISDNKDSIKIKLQGKVEIKSGIASVITDVEYSYPLSVKDIIDKYFGGNSKLNNLVKIEGSSIEDFQLTNSKIKINFIVQNPFIFPLILKSYAADIYLNNKYSGKGNLLTSRIIIPPMSNKSGVFLFKSENLKSLVASLSTFLTGKLEYTTKGNLDLEVSGTNFSVPFSANGFLINIKE